MRIFFSPDSFTAQRPSFLVNTLILALLMVLYSLAGELLFWLINGERLDALSLMHSVSTMISLMRLIQVAGQILVFAIPVILLAGWHTGSRNVFSRRSLAFLGIGMRPHSGAIFPAVAGIFLLLPVLFTITALQDLYLWPALGAAGSAVVSQRDMMDSFIKALAVVRSTPELFSVVLVFSLTPAVCEELFFRGYIQQNYTRSMSSAKAVLLTGVVFAFFHLSPANLLPLAFLGWYIGYVYSASGSLMVPFAAHLANNLAALLMLYAAERGFSLNVSAQIPLLQSVWWWVVVAGSLSLFALVIRRFFPVISSVAEEGEEKYRSDV